MDEEVSGVCGPGMAEAHLRIQFTSLPAPRGVMAEEKHGVYSEEPPPEYPGPYVEDREELNGDAGDEGANDQTVKCSPNLLQMLKAAESRWTDQSRDRERGDLSESLTGERENALETGELVTEALKTDMVSLSTLSTSHYRLSMCKPQEA